MTAGVVSGGMVARALATGRAGGSDVRDCSRALLSTLDGTRGVITSLDGPGSNT